MALQLVECSPGLLIVHWIWSLVPRKPGMVVHVRKLNPGEVRQMDQKFRVTLD